MKLTTNQLRSIIKEELTLVLETKAARNWIAKQDEDHRDRLMDFYEAGMKNIPDLSYALKEFPVRYALGDLELIKAYYSSEYKNMLNQYGIRQLKDFEEQGYSFERFMRSLIDYDKIKDVKSSDLTVSKLGKIIGQVGDWTITDPVSGTGSTKCAAGTTWCTANPVTYDRYIKGDIKLYYLSNDKKEYPNNKLSFGVNKDGIRYGGDGEFTVNADNDGIRSYDHARQIIGDDFDEIKSILLDYYPKDMERRSSHKDTEDRIFLNFINFTRAAKKLDSSQRILFYKRVVDYVYNEDYEHYRDISDLYFKHLIKIFDFILKDKEMKNKEFLTKEKDEIMKIILKYYSKGWLLRRIPIEERIKKFNLIYKSLVNKYSPSRHDMSRSRHVLDTLEEIYPEDQRPENMLPTFVKLTSEAIEETKKELEGFYEIANSDDPGGVEDDIFWVEKDLEEMKDKFETYKRKLQ